MIINGFQDMIDAGVPLESIVKEMYDLMEGWKKERIIKKLLPRWSDILDNYEIKEYIKKYQFIDDHVEIIPTGGNWVIDDYGKVQMYKCLFCGDNRVDSRSYHHCEIYNNILKEAESLHEFVIICNNMGVDITEVGIINRSGK